MSCSFMGEYGMYAVYTALEGCTAVQMSSSPIVSLYGPYTGRSRLVGPARLKTSLVHDLS